jgi:hypothetical protein
LEARLLPDYVAFEISSGPSWLRRFQSVGWIRRPGLARGVLEIDTFFSILLGFR